MDHRADQEHQEQHQEDGELERKTTPAEKS